MAMKHRTVRVQRTSGGFAITLFEDPPDSDSGYLHLTETEAGALEDCLTSMRHQRDITVLVRDPNAYEAKGGKS